MGKEITLEEMRRERVAQNHRGVFGADCGGLCDALGEYEGVQVQPSAEGVRATVLCGNCGSEKLVVLGYPELIAVKYGVPPQAVFMQVAGLDVSPWGFAAEHRAWFPDVRCQCQGPLHVLISSAEAESYLTTARRNGWLHPQNEAQLSQIAAAARGR